MAGGRKKEHTLLSATDRAKLKDWGGTGWLASPRRLLARRRAMRTIGKLVDAQKAAKAPWPEDPRVLAGLLAVSLRADGTVVDYFNSRSASDLKTDEEWDKFFELFGLAHLEQWLEQEEGAAPSEPPELVVEDEYLDSLQDLLELARSEGQRNQAEAQKVEGSSAFNMAKVSDLTKETRERLQAYLEESDFFAHDAAGDGDIPEHEQEREIETAALSRLKLSELEELAAEKGVPMVASKEHLAELIVRRSDVSREEIAELALRGTDLSIEAGLTTRLFPLCAEPVISYTGERLKKAEGKYLRLRLARWFVYDQVSLAASSLVLRGRIRSYRTKPVLEVEGHRLNATPHSGRVVVRLRAGRSWAEVDCRQVSDAHDMSIVMARSSGLRFDPVLGLPLPALADVLGTWDRLTVWMLAFLQSHLDGNGISIQNYSMAHFATADTGTPVQPDEPRIAEVQLRGQHVGSSRDACQRIIDGGRLLAVELMLTYAPNRQERHFIPVRIGVDDTCATIETAAGKKIPAAASSALHRTLIDRVRHALEVDFDPKQLDDVVDKTVDHARAREPVQHADMFAPDLTAIEGQDPQSDNM